MREAELELQESVDQLAAGGWGYGLYCDRLVYC